jgi:hypothetical protein
LAVIIPGSDHKPHFTGHSYIREGSQTKKSSEDQFAALIAERSGKVREILKWKGKQITLRSWEERASFVGLGLSKGGSAEFTLEDCNQYFVTIGKGSAQDGLSLASIELSHDYSSQRLRLEIHSL